MYVLAHNLLIFKCEGQTEMSLIFLYAFIELHSLLIFHP